MDEVTAGIDEVCLVLDEPGFLKTNFLFGSVIGRGAVLSIFSETSPGDDSNGGLSSLTPGADSIGS